MSAKGLILAALALASAGCTVEPAISQTASTPTASPTVLLRASATTSPTLVPSASATNTATTTPTSTVTQTPTPEPTRTPGPEATYKRLIVVDQDVQTMYVYENGEQIRRIPVSTGKPDQVETMTPAWEGEVGRYVGTFFAFDVWADDAWYLFDHYGSMLIHSAPYIKENEHKVYQELELLGVRPASHGCIRLPPEDSEWFTAWEPQGAYVIILPLTSP
jgi:lipoprotein-anchoring transpeptidase ErfK/SrfK